MYRIHGYMRSMMRIRWTDVALVVLAGLLVMWYVYRAGGGFPLDDSWIHQVYGRNLGQAGEWAFILGEPSAASTAPLYTVLLALGYAVNIPFRLWTHGLGIVALALTGIIGTRLAALLEPERRGISFLIGVALVVTWHLLWAAASGMETMLFGMFSLVLIGLGWQSTGEARPTPLVARQGLIFGVFAGLMTLTRPEGIVLAGLVGLVRLLYQPRQTVIWGLGAAVGFGLVLAPYLLYNVQVTGGLLPDTAAAKQAQAAPILANVPYSQRVLDMLKPLAAGGQILLLPGLAYYVIKVVRKRSCWLWWLLPVLWGVALALLYAARLPAAYQHGRYVMPALPALIVAGGVGLAWLLRDTRRSLIGRVLTRSLAMAAALLFVFYAVVTGAATYARDVAIINEEMVTAAHWLAENVPPDDLLAIHDIGAVGYFAPRPLLDIAGLVSPEVVPIILDEAALWDLMQARNAQYLMVFPDQIPGGDAEENHLCPVFSTNNAAARDAGGANMTIYALKWDGNCES
jgi:hypothetical protein